MKSDDSWIALALVALAALIACGLLWRGGSAEAWGALGVVVGIVGGWLGRGRIDQARAVIDAAPKALDD